MKEKTSSLLMFTEDIKGMQNRPTVNVRTYHLTRAAWERSVDPLQMNVVRLNSAAGNNLLLAFLLTLYPWGRQLNIDRSIAY